ncbi:hypothetical protein ON010_g8953 [Phytophthora cinnamomi]|nr:hypothetical protein ON010_g8953 [Phytophthora cinnamomi]
MVDRRNSKLCLGLARPLTHHHASRDTISTAPTSGPRGKRAGAAVSGETVGRQSVSGMQSSEIDGSDPDDMHGVEQAASFGNALSGLKSWILGAEPQREIRVIYVMSKIGVDSRSCLNSFSAGQSENASTLNPPIARHPALANLLRATQTPRYDLQESARRTDYGWTPRECQVFWAALDRYPRGPWTVIADFIGTKSTRQAMTHGQKLRQKLKRWITRLHRNPAARSLMNGSGAIGAATTATSISSISSANASVSMAAISVTVSIPLSDAASTSKLPDRTIPSTPMNTTLYPIACQEDDTTNLAPGQQPRLAVKTNSGSVTPQVNGEATSSRPPETAAYSSSRSLQMLFEPNVMTGPVASTATMHFDETKQDGASVIPNPINEVAMPVRNLLDELADVLWNDHRGDTK